MTEGHDPRSQHRDRRPPPWPLDRRHYVYRLREHFASTKSALNEAVHRVLAVARTCGFTDNLSADLEISLREALANGIIHGNAYDAGKRVFLRCYGAKSDGVLILIRDEGPGFDPAKVPDPRADDRKHLHHGRGLLLMRELMDFVEYRREGREVLLFKSCVETKA